MDRLGTKAFVSDVLFIMALSTMFFSIVMPFATVVPVIDWKHVYFDEYILPLPRDYSTFSIRYIVSSYSMSFYFGDYWFQWNEATQGSSFISNLLVLTFAMQVLTLAVGFVVFWKNRLLRILPMLIWTSVIILLTYTLSQIFSHDYFWPYVGVGYWLSLVAIFLVSGSVVLGRRKRV